MIFQFTGVSGQLQNVMRILEQWGFVDAFLPFLLLFVLIFAILNRLDIFKSGEKTHAADSRRLNGLIAFAISLMVVIPHLLGRYPANMDPIILINKLLPSGAIMLVAILMLLLLLGIVGAQLPSTGGYFIAVIAMGILAFIIAITLWPSFAPGTFLQDPSTQALIIILLVMGLVVWFVTRPESTETEAERKARLDAINEGKAKGLLEGLFSKIQSK